MLFCCMHTKTYWHYFTKYPLLDSLKNKEKWCCNHIYKNQAAPMPWLGLPMIFSILHNVVKLTVAPLALHNDNVVNFL